MQTKAKGNSVITHALDGDKITFTVLGAGAVVMDTTKLADAIMQRAAIHGLIQRISDAAALGRDPDTGRSASPMDKLSAMTELVAYYETGTEEWKRTGTGEGGGKSITIEAIAKVKSVPYEVAVDYVERYAKAKFEGDTKKTLAFLRKSGSVAEAIAEIRKSRQGAPVVDADKALDEMGAEILEKEDKLITDILA